MKTHALPPATVPYQFHLDIELITFCELSRSRKTLIRVDSGVGALLSALTWLHINQWIPFPFLCLWLHGDWFWAFPALLR